LQIAIAVKLQPFPEKVKFQSAKMFDVTNSVVFHPPAPIYFTPTPPLDLCVAVLMFGDYFPASALPSNNTFRGLDQRGFVCFVLLGLGFREGLYLVFVLIVLIFNSVTLDTRCRECKHKYAQQHIT